jgi:hypothetical protein
MRNGNLGIQSKRSLIELALRIEHTVQIRVVYDSFPDLQVLFARIEWLVGRPPDILLETDVPRSAEADPTEPFKAFLN